MAGSITLERKHYGDWQMEGVSASLLAGSSSGSRSVKELVIAVLSSQWPLSARAIFSKMGSPKGKNFSYQGVHKALCSLAADGVVSKDGGGYALSKSWLEVQGRWLSDAKKQYSGGSPLRLSSLLPNSSVMHNFTGVISVPYWVLDNIADSITPDDVIVEQWFFAWPAQMVSEEQHKQVKKFAKCVKFVLCRGNSPGDLYCLEYLSKAVGVKYLAGVQVAYDCDVIAFRDFVINIYWPASFKQTMRKAFSEPSVAASMQEVYDYVFFGEGAQLQIPVVITRNAEMAKQIIVESMALFEKQKVKA